MKEKSYSTRVLRSARSDPSGSRDRYRLSAKLRARMKKLEKWRIRPSAIKAPSDAHQFHGGLAAVSKAFLLDHDEERHCWDDLYDSKEVMQLCRQSAESDDHIRGAAVDRPGAEGEGGDEGKDDEEELGFDSDDEWYGEFIAVKKSRIGDNKDMERVLGLALREMKFLVELDHENIVEPKGFVEDLSNDIIWLVFPWEQVQNQPQPFQASFCASSNTITLSGNKYTLRWDAPEVLSDEQMSLWSDTWAFGVMTNSIPFEEVPADAIVDERVINGDLPSITDHARARLLRELCSLMIMCWNSNPGERPTAEDCRKAIDWMPKILPNPTRGPDTAVSTIRSPELLTQLGYMYQWQSDYERQSVRSVEPRRGASASNRGQRGYRTLLRGPANPYRHRRQARQSLRSVGSRLCASASIRVQRGHRALFAVPANPYRHPRQGRQSQRSGRSRRHSSSPGSPR